MSGHSKWATIKRAKAVNDAKRGAIFTKLGNMITITAREKGGDPETNFSLRMAIDKARQSNMPKETIEKAIKRGIGELEGGQIEELIYEGIGPANSHYIVKSVTDNKNRSAATIRHIFTKYGGSLGAVMWNFEQKGIIRIDMQIINELNANWDELELEIIDAGAEDLKKEEEGVTILINMADLQKVKKFFEKKKIKTESVDIEYAAKDKMKISGEEAEKIEKFEEELDDCEDVADYYNNIIISM